MADNTIALGVKGGSGLGALLGGGMQGFAQGQAMEQNRQKMAMAQAQEERAATLQGKQIEQLDQQMTAADRLSDAKAKLTAMTTIKLAPQGTRIAAAEQFLIDNPDSPAAGILREAIATNDEDALMNIVDAGAMEMTNWISIDQTGAPVAPVKRQTEVVGNDLIDVVTNEVIYSGAPDAKWGVVVDDNGVPRHAQLFENGEVRMTDAEAPKGGGVNVNLPGEGGLEKKRLADALLLETSSTGSRDLSGQAFNLYDEAKDLDLSAGVEGTVSEFVKGFFGTEDESSDFKRRVKEVTISQTLGMLTGLGAASDADIRMVRSTAPDENSSRDHIMSYMGALGRVEARNAAAATLQAQWLENPENENKIGGRSEWVESQIKERERTGEFLGSTAGDYTVEQLDRFDVVDIKGRRRGDPLYQEPRMFTAPDGGIIAQKPDGKYIYLYTGEEYTE